MIEAATARGISSLISTNFSVPFDAERAEQLVASGLTILGVSLDGAKQETYEQYRVRGNLETVLRNVRLVNDAKRKLGSATPKLIWSFHVFPHNADDVEQARAMAAELDMEFAVEKAWVVGDEWDPDGRFTYYGNPRPFPCVPLWEYAVLNNDGGIAPCCGSFYSEDDVGRVSAQTNDAGARTFREVWNGPALPPRPGLLHPTRRRRGGTQLHLLRLPADRHLGALATPHGRRRARAGLRSGLQPERRLQLLLEPAEAAQAGR